jgi:hypothetical protein
MWTSSFLCFLLFYIRKINPLQIKSVRVPLNSMKKEAGYIALSPLVEGRPNRCGREKFPLSGKSQHDVKMAPAHIALPSSRTIGRPMLCMYEKEREITEKLLVHPENFSIYICFPSHRLPRPLPPGICFSC